MWISADGRAIANAWANPAAALPSSAAKLIDSMSRKARKSFGKDVRLALMGQLDLIDSFAATTTPEIEAEFRGEWMPADAIAHLKSRTPDELVLELTALELRWRLDAYQVVLAYLD